VLVVQQELNIITKKIMSRQKHKLKIKRNGKHNIILAIVSIVSGVVKYIHAIARIAKKIIIIKKPRNTSHGNQWIRVFIVGEWST
jgi:hypothetical protein